MFLTVYQLHQVCCNAQHYIFFDFIKYKVCALHQQMIQLYIIVWHEDYYNISEEHSHMKSTVIRGHKRLYTPLFKRNMM